MVTGTRHRPDNTRLIALDAAGIWNRPLLENAAAISDAECVFAQSDPCIAGEATLLDPTGRMRERVLELNEALEGFEHVIACEAVRESVSIYDFPAPRGKTAIIVGNEEAGIPRSVFNKADKIVSIPMSGAGMSSVNVAVSAAIALYVLSKDMGRKMRARSRLTHRDVDILIHAPHDPHELGSLLRSVWAFGWRCVYLHDPHGAWFTRDKKVVLDGRAAARRHKNPLVVLPGTTIQRSLYDAVLMLSGNRDGSPLSRLRLPTAHRLLVEIGDADISGAEQEQRAVPLFIDSVKTDKEIRFRHAGSIALSLISNLLGG